MRAIACAALLLLCGCGTRFGGPASGAEWDREAVDAKPVVREDAVVLPPYPQAADLVEFEVGARGSHRYFLDVRTLDVGKDGVVRYAVVVRTAGGASSTGYEGIRCASYEKRVYAVGHPQGKWIEAKRSVWEPIQSGRRNEHQDVLYKEFFCPDRAPASRDAAIRALRNSAFGSTRNLRD